MQFSVIIPTYNRSKFILKTIQSVLEQTYSYFEIIVVDDGSTDDTEELVKSIKDYRLKYYKKANSERGAARNFGTLKAIGDYVTFLDSDDLLYPEHLKVAHETSQQKQHPEIFHLGYEIKNQNGKILTRINHLPATINEELIKGNVLSCRGIFLRADIAKNNLFNENRILSGLEDWELWLRIAAQFPIYTNNSITSALINHVDRSVVGIQNFEPLLDRFDVLLDCILSNPAIVSYYKNSINIFKSSCYSYIALHLALTKKYKSEAITYLVKAIKENPKSIFTKRFLAIFKHLLI